jgi:hypothetical protein
MSLPNLRTRSLSQLTGIQVYNSTVVVSDGMVLSEVAAPSSALVKGSQVTGRRSPGTT